MAGNVIPFRPREAEASAPLSDREVFGLLSEALALAAPALRALDLAPPHDADGAAGPDKLADHVTVAELRGAVLVFDQLRRDLGAALRNPEDPRAVFAVLATAMVAGTELDVLMPSSRDPTAANGVRGRN